MKHWIGVGAAIALFGCGTPSPAPQQTPCEGLACADDPDGGALPDVSPEAAPDLGLSDDPEEPESCVPDCQGRACGPDGCGAACGQCDSDAPVCHQGACLAVPKVIIGEIMADNDGAIVDEDGEASDWIELQNRDAQAISLDGCFLTDDMEKLDKWRLPAVEMAPGDVIVLFASGKDRAAPGAPLHTSFRLDRAGEPLALVMPDGETIIDQIEGGFPPQAQGESYGVAQAVDLTTLVAPGALAAWIIPEDDSDVDTWTLPGFDDSGWSRGPTALGYNNGRPAPPDPGRDPNLALGKPAVQSSQLGAFDPGLAVDGDNGNFTHTFFSDLDATWEIDLGQSSLLTLIVLNNRTSCCQSRLRDITVSVLDDADDVVYASALLNPENVDGGPRQIAVDLLDQVGGVLGRKVRVHRTPDPDLSGTQGAGNADEAAVLSLAEVEVYGAGQGLGAPLATDVEAQMAGISASAWLRLPFEIEDPGALEQLRLRVQFDAGFVASLNGHRVASVQAPDDLDWRSTATGPEPDEPQSVDLNITAALQHLQPGPNVLAIHALNSSADDEDLLILPELVALSVRDVDLRFFPEPTPGRVNDTEGFLGDTEVSFSHPHGFIEAPFELTLSPSPPEATIRYTLDGSLPTETHGEIYEAPLAIDRTTIVRAIASLPEHRTRPARAATWLMLSDIVRQSPETTIAAGFPASWGNTAADYGLDPRVIGEADDYEGRYAATIEADLRAIPSLSLAVSIDDMFGPEGIYTHSNRRGDQYRIPASAELIEPDGQPGFQINCGLTIQGGAFRSHGLTLKHSLRLIFSAQFGPTKLRHPWFGPGASDSLDTVTLRANSNDGWQWSDAGDKPLFIRDSFGRQTVLDMGGVASRETWVHLYINGVYWGLYNPVQRPDASSSAAWFGGQKEDWDSVSNGQASNGDLEAWNTLLALSAAGFEDNDAYQRVQGLNPDGSDNPEWPAWVDVHNLADYMIANLYVGNTDWPHKNYWIGRHRSGLEGFKFYMWDSEWSLGLRSELDTDRVGVNNGVAAPGAALVRSAEFRLLVADHLHRHFFNGGALYVDPDAPQWDPDNPERNRPAARFVALADAVEAALVAESARWGDQHRGTPYTRDEHWRVERDRLLRDYFPARSQRVLEQFRRAGLYPDIEAPTFEPHGGVVDEGSPLIIQAPEGVVLTTLDGSDPRLPGGAIAPGAFETTDIVPLPPGRVEIKSRALREGTWSALNAATYDVIP